MRPKRTFFRAERAWVVPPEGESPPQAPPGALPAAGAPSNWWRERWEIPGGRADQPTATDFEAAGRVKYIYIYDAVRGPIRPPAGGQLEGVHNKQTTSEKT
jgi:hypothetical protein